MIYVMGKCVIYADSVCTYEFPACLADTFILENGDLQNKYKQESSNANFEQFKNLYKHAVNAEIAYLREKGGKLCCREGLLMIRQRLY